MSPPGLSCGASLLRSYNILSANMAVLSGSNKRLVCINTSRAKVLKATSAKVPNYEPIDGDFVFYSIRHIAIFLGQIVSIVKRAAHVLVLQML